MIDPKDAMAQTLHKPPQTQVELVRGMTVRRTKGGLPVARIHYAADPKRDPDVHPEWKTAQRKTYSSQAAWDREQDIRDEAGGGDLVFADTLITYWNKIVITDPAWRPSASWRVLGGFDHGKTNPTALERVYIDYDGVIYCCGEYYFPGREVWEHAPVIKSMPDYARMKPVWADPTIFDETLQQSQVSDASAPRERAKSVNQLYVQQGVKIFSPYSGDRADTSFAQRLLMHWSDLEHRAPTVRIVCRNYAEKPVPGMHAWDCPNLLWELMQRRHVKLSAQQLLVRNRSEAIVDKDNHANDACFVAGTLVTTRRGEVPIEAVMVGDEALTRQGWRRVTAAAMTSPAADIWRVAFSNGAVLFVTAAHPIWTERYGFLRADALRYGDACACAGSNFVLASVQVSSVEKTPLRLPVYNVSVEDKPEYFANGVLVHNCKYLLMSLPKPTLKTIEEIAAAAVKEQQLDPTSALIRYNDLVAAQKKQDSTPARLTRRPITRPSFRRW